MAHPTTPPQGSLVTITTPRGAVFHGIVVEVADDYLILQQGQRVRAMVYFDSIAKWNGF